MAGREFLHTPGPSHVPGRVLGAMQRQPMDPFDPRLLALSRSCFEDLKLIFGTRGKVFIYAATGHGGWEAVLTNLLVPGDTVLVPEIGHFSNSWAEHARALGIETQLIVSDWRRAVDPAEIEACLRQDRERRIKAVLAVQVDTATGIVSDIPAIRRAIDAAGHPALLVVDAIASLGAMPFEMDAWGVDVTVTASQKALMCPPGLAIVAANDRALAVSDALSPPRYWDWGVRRGPDYFMRFCGTMPEHLVFALREALDQIREEGLPAIIERHRRLASAVHAAVTAWSEGGAISFNAAVPEQRSWSVTTIRVKGPGPDAAELRRHLRTRLDLAVAGGFGPLADGVFRIGHLGDLNEPMILGCLATVEVGFRELGMAYRTGIDAAIGALARRGVKAGP